MENIDIGNQILASNESIEFKLLEPSPDGPLPRNQAQLSPNSFEFINFPDHENSPKSSTDPLDSHNPKLNNNLISHDSLTYSNSNSTISQKPIQFQGYQHGFDVSKSSIEESKPGEESKIEKQKDRDFKKNKKTMEKDQQATEPKRKIQFRLKARNVDFPLKQLSGNAEKENKPINNLLKPHKRKQLHEMFLVKASQSILSKKSMSLYTDTINDKIIEFASNTNKENQGLEISNTPTLYKKYSNDTIANQNSLISLPNQRNRSCSEHTTSQIEGQSDSLNRQKIRNLRFKNKNYQKNMTQRKLSFRDRMKSFNMQRKVRNSLLFEDQGSPSNPALEIIAKKISLAERDEKDIRQCLVNRKRAEKYQQIACAVKMQMV